MEGRGNYLDIQTEAFAVRQRHNVTKNVLPEIREKAKKSNTLDHKLDRVSQGLSYNEGLELKLKQIFHKLSFFTFPGFEASELFVF